MIITVYAGARSPTPAQVDDLTWDETVDALRELIATAPPAVVMRDGVRDTAEEKVRLLAFAPHRLREGATRAAGSVEAVTALVIDVDGCDLAALRGAVAELGIAAVVYGSPSDDAAASSRRVRVVAPVTRDLAPAECAATRFAFAEALGLAPGQGVEGAIDASRLFFAGRLDGTADRYFETFDGVPVDVDALAPASDAWAAPVPRASTAPAPAATSSDPAITAARGAVLGALGPASEHDGRKHALCGAVGGVLRHAGWTRDDAAAAVREWIRDDARDVEHGVRWATAAWDKLPEDVSGRGALDALVGPRAGAVLEAAALLPFRVGVAPAREPTPSAPYATLRLIDLAAPPPPPAYVVEGLDLAPGKVSAVQGFANAGKTPFALALATCVAAGVPFLGMPVSARGVAYFDHEASPLTVERAYRIRVGLGLATPPTGLVLAEAGPLSEALLDDARRLIADRGIGMIVIDTYSSALPADAGFNEATFRVWATELGRLSNATGTLIVILVHDSKEKGRGLRGISGSGLLAGALQASIALEGTEDRNVVDVACTRAARRGFDPFRIRWTDREDGALVATRETAPAEAPAAKPAATVAKASDAQRVRVAGERIMRVMEERWTTPSELARIGGSGAPAANAAVARLVDAGLLELRAGSYGRTPAGREADADAVRRALGTVAGFTR